MANETIITKYDLNKRNTDALIFLKKWVAYMEDLGDYTIRYNKAVADGTTPPGDVPNPPGIPPR